MRSFFSNPIALILIAVMAFQAITRGEYGSPMDWLMDSLLVLPAIFIGLSFHEFAHAWVANRCGDPTPKYQNRVTINPAAHIDPIGLIALFFIGFGWGRPVMVNPRNFKHPRRDELLVALAGVTMNLILAFLFMGVLRLLYAFGLEFLMTDLGGIVESILSSIIYINIVLMIFNLLPIPPLDGFNVITQVFNLKNTEFYYRVYDKGFLILMVLILFNVTDKIIPPAVMWVYLALINLFF